MRAVGAIAVVTPGKMRRAGIVAGIGPPCGAALFRLPFIPPVKAARAMARAQDRPAGSVDIVEAIEFAGEAAMGIVPA